MLKNTALLAVSILISFFLGELLVRANLNSDDFLTPVVKSNQQFKYMMFPNSGGHDRWGFRNDSVPQRSPIW